MADLVRDRDLDVREHELVATTVARALDCVYLQHRVVTEKDSACIEQLTTSSTWPSRYLLPTLPYVLGFSPGNEDISLICMASMSARTFWEYVAERLELENTHLPKSSNATLKIQTRKIAALREVGLSAFSEAQIVISYCAKPEDFNSQNNFEIQAPLVNENDALARLFDQQLLVNEVSARLGKAAEGDSERMVGAFRSGYHQFHHWTVAHGLLSPELGLLNSECLSTIFATYFCQRTTDMDVNTDDLLRKFFVSHLATLFGCGSDKTEVKTLTPSGRNLTARIGPDNLLAIREEIQRAIRPYEAHDQVNLDNSVENGLGGFTRMHRLHVKLDTHCWNARHRPDFHASMPHVLLALQTKIRTSSDGSQSARIWPHPLINTSREDDDDSNRSYLLGINILNRDRSSIHKELLDRALSSFIPSLRYDRSSALITHAVLPSRSLLSLLSSLSHSQGRNTTDRYPVPNPSSSSSTVTKFRTAAAVLDRLRWDPSHAATDYEVGYADRFEEGLVWRALERWERHVEDEEFVPEHRIWKVRRAGDGAVVWDRERRWDGTGE